MADNLKYYYMRLKENFFDSNEMVLLESMQDGYLYSNILLKLYLGSLRDNGRLMFNERIPYSAQMIATITRHDVHIVEKALVTFKEMGLIEILDTGAIYMMDIQQYIGKSSTEADRKRDYRQRIYNEKMGLGQMSGQTSDKSTPEIEIELEKEIYNTIAQNVPTEPLTRVTVSKKALLKEFDELWKLYPNKKSKSKAMKLYIKARTRKYDSVSFEQVKNGIVSYVEYITKTKMDMQYVKHGSTWFYQECWNDDYTISNNQNNSWY